MRNQRSYSQSRLCPTILLSVVLAFLGLVYFAGHYKYLTVAAAAVAIYLLTSRDLSRLRSIPAMLLLLYVVFAGLTRFWAISGKFFLVEYSRIFVAAVFFVAVVTTKNFNHKSARKIMSVIAGVSAIYSLLSMEAASTGFSKTLLSVLIPGYDTINTGFEAGTRLTGILGNANILSTVVALGIFCSICLLCEAETRRDQQLWAGVSAVNAFTFLLLFSMGGTACFILAILFYLIFAGEKRGSTLIRMLECALPTLLWVFVAFPFFNREGIVVIIPLIALVGDIITVILLEKALAPKLIPVLEQRAKLVWGMLAGVIALACVYVVLGMTMTGAHTFGTDALRRSSYPAAGEHTLSVQADGEVNVTITSQNMSQVMMHTDTVLYSGSAAEAVFTVPEDSKVCYFTFSAQPGVVLEEAVLDSGESLKLKYTLFPGFIANRLQGLKANQNAIQRTVFFEDGMKMFRQSPVVGNGIGSFQTGVTSVQDFFYETKYIHNHYIQTLLEAGILGLIPFVGGLLGLGWLLLKRRKEENWEFRGVYPALWASLVMLIAHMMVEVSMSMIVALIPAFTVFGLIVRCCTAVPENVKEVEQPLPIKLACVALPAVFLLTLGLNIGANKVVNSYTTNYQSFLEKLSLAATIDPYENNDYKLSYVMVTLNNNLTENIPQANEYAENLMGYQSNTIPFSLLQYYLSTGQYPQAFEAAIVSTVYSGSSHKVWNNTATLLQSALLDPMRSPLLFDKDSVNDILDGLTAYSNALHERNAASMEPIQLDAKAASFFDTVAALAVCDRSPEQISRILNGI